MFDDGLAGPRPRGEGASIPGGRLDGAALSQPVWLADFVNKVGAIPLAIAAHPYAVALDAADLLHCAL